MIELIEKGRILMWPLMGCAIIVLAIFIERFFYFHRVSMHVGDLLHGIANQVKKGNFSEALYECSASSGPIARVIHSALIRHDLPRSELKEIVTEAGQLEVPRLERYLTVLITVINLVPMLGLLGTVIGLVDTFLELNSVGGSATPARLSAGIYQSLITSATGLAIAVPSYIIYAYLCGVAKNIMHDMERAGIEIVNIIHDERNNLEMLGVKNNNRSVNKRSEILLKKPKKSLAKKS